MAKKKTDKKKEAFKPTDLKLRCAVLYANDLKMKLDPIGNRYTTKIVGQEKEKDGGVVVKPELSLVPLKSTINTCLSIGIFTFYIVAGKFNNEVKTICNELISKYPKNYIKFIYVDDDSDTMDGAITKGVDMASKDEFVEIYVMSGDTIITGDILSRLKDVPRHAVLVNKIQSIDLTRQAVAFSSGSAIVNGFWSDSENTGKLPEDFNELVAYASCNIWKFYNTEALKKSVNLIMEDYLSGNSSYGDGYDLVNTIAYNDNGMFPVFVDKKWVHNVRDDKDVEEIKEILRMGS